MIYQISISIENISAEANYNSWWSSEKGIHATITPLSCFDVFADISEGLDDPVGGIILVLVKAEK